MTRTRVTMARCEIKCVRTEHLLILVVAFLLLLVPVRAQIASGSDITIFGPSFATQKRWLAERALAVTRDTPIADNSTVTGRQKNRPVEIIVSGEIIG